MGSAPVIKLFSNGGKEDKEAFALLTQAQIPFTNFGPSSEESTPIVEFDHWKFYGLDAIKDFIRVYAERTASQAGA